MFRIMRREDKFTTNEANQENSFSNLFCGFSFFSSCTGDFEWGTAVNQICRWMLEYWKYIIYFNQWKIFQYGSFYNEWFRLKYCSQIMP